MCSASETLRIVVPQSPCQDRLTAWLTKAECAAVACSHAHKEDFVKVRVLASSVYGAPLRRCMRCGPCDHLMASTLVQEGRLVECTVLFVVWEFRAACRPPQRPRGQCICHRGSAVFLGGRPSSRSHSFCFRFDGVLSDACQPMWSVECVRIRLLVGPSQPKYRRWCGASPMNTASPIELRQAGRRRCCAPVNPQIYTSNLAVACGVRIRTVGSCPSSSSGLRSGLAGAPEGGRGRHFVADGRRLSCRARWRWCFPVEDSLDASFLRPRLLPLGGATAGGALVRGRGPAAGVARARGAAAGGARSADLRRLRGRTLAEARALKRRP